MKQLVIKGHAIRGKEIIDLLEMFGAHRLGYNDTFTEFYYYIEDGAICSSEKCPRYAIVFTLEEFIQRYPYKIGDKVIYTKFGDNYSVTIESMEWTGTTIEYTFNGVTCLTKDLKMWDSNDMGLKIEKNTNMNIEFDLTKYSYEFKDGKLVISERKPKYPTTYKDCCKVLMGKTNFQDFELVLTKLSTNRYEENSISPEPPYISLINNFYKLVICRDAYWKIAGEKMGLGKLWKPDWAKADETKYCIVNTEWNVMKWAQKTTHKTLAFPTEEMRDAFYENFKDLIEQCKELL